MFWSFSDYGVDCHFLLTRVKPDGPPLLNKGEAAQALKNVEDFFVWIAQVCDVLFKGFGYLLETVYVHGRVFQ